MTHDYKRNGTTMLFAALEVLQGKVAGQCYKRHRHQEFLKFLRRLDQEFPGQTPPAPRDGQLWDTQASQGGVDPTVVSPAAISITAAPAERSCQGRNVHTGSRAPISAA